MKAAFLRWAAAALLTVQLPACNFSASVETLLSPPRLTAEQEQIYQALQASAGNSISLKYPKHGEHLSAFTVVDLDGDGLDEAIVFYNVSLNTDAENPLRLCMLKQQNGEWKAGKDYPAAGAEIERVDVSASAGSPHTNLIISYSQVDGGGYTAEVFLCENGELVRPLKVPYSAMSLRDLDGDGKTELLTVTAAKLPNPAQATVYSLSSYARDAAVQLPETMTDITRLVFGELPRKDGRGTVPAIYADGASGATNAQTAVMTYTDGVLATVYTDSADHIPNTLRPAGCRTLDIDSDGEPEIPVQAVFYGYTAGTDGPQGLPMTNWYVCRNGLLMRECASYYAVSDGYIFLMPPRWERRVTAVQENEEIVFYEFDRSTQNEDGTPVLKAPLLRLCSVNDPVAANAMQLDGYLLLRQQNGSYYLGKRESGAPDALALAENELVTAMRYP
ncbi:MAG: hypothetical protein K6E36_00070 [Oscillospiraceae bacterium]|nr:hypothetical protein [Oscillospiraceae bacterium]